MIKTLARRLVAVGGAGVIAVGLVAGVMPRPVAALTGGQFRAARIIDDSVFFDSSRMSEKDISNFLKSKVPSCDTMGAKPYAGTTRKAYSQAHGVNPPFICLKDYKQTVPAKAADAYCSGAVSAGQKTSAQIIKQVANACNVSPMVLIVLLQKEQALVTDDWPWPTQYQKATGYGCPDSSSCDPTFAGFFNQVWYAARQFQRYRIQADLFGYKAGRSNYIQYNANTSCNGTNITIQGQATAGLYNYTPYQPNAAALNNLYGTGDGCSAYGNRNFWRLYNDWFGPSLTDRCSYDPAGSISTGIAFRKFQRGIDSANLLIYSGTGTVCVESHTWQIGGFSSWLKHTATNQQVINSADGEVQFADLNGDGIDEGILIGYRNTGSGMVEFHVWDSTLKKWIVHTATNLPAVDPGKMVIRFADLNGDGIDEPLAVALNDTSTGMVEIHTWGDSVMEWKYHVVTNLPAVNLTNMNIEFADLNGDGKDEGVAIGLSGTVTNKIEFHVWNPGFATWLDHYTTTQDAINSADGEVLFADLDGDKKDMAVLIGRHNTGSGRIEFHVWNTGFGSWQGHYASNQGVLP